MFDIYSHKTTGLTMPALDNRDIKSLYELFKYFLKSEKKITYSALNDQILSFNTGAFFEESTYLIFDDGEKKIESRLLKINNNEWQVVEDISTINKNNLTIYHKIYSSFSFDDNKSTIKHKNGSILFHSVSSNNMNARIEKNGVFIDCKMDYFPSSLGSEFVFFASDDSFCLAQNGMNNRRLFLFSFCNNGVLSRNHLNSKDNGQSNDAYSITNGINTSYAANFNQSIMSSGGLILQRWAPLGVLTDGILSPFGALPATIGNYYTMHKSETNYVYFLSYDNCVIPFLGSAI